MKDHKRAFISLKMKELSDSGKTQIWKILNRNEDDYLGEVKWFSHWRKYVFFPEISTHYDDECLKEISSFLTDLNYIHKKQRESKMSGDS